MAASLMAASVILVLSSATARADGNFFITNATAYDWCMVTIGFTDGSSQEQKVFKNMTGQWLKTGKCLQSIKGTCANLSGGGPRPKDVTGQNICVNASYHIEKLFTDFHYETQFVKQ